MSSVQSEHLHRKHHFSVQSSTKHDCPATAVIREICWFPAFKVMLHFTYIMLICVPDGREMTVVTNVDFWTATVDMALVA